MAENIQQALQLARTNAQLSILLTFSNESREDRTSAIEWLQKVINNKQGAGWTNIQTVTHFRNALKGEVLKWFNALPPLNTDNLNWKVVNTQFEQDFRASHLVSSVIKKYQKSDKKTMSQ